MMVFGWSVHKFSSMCVLKGYHSNMRQQLYVIYIPRIAYVNTRLPEIITCGYPTWTFPNSEMRSQCAPDDVWVSTTRVSHPATVSAIIEGSHAAPPTFVLAHYLSRQKLSIIRRAWTPNELMIPLAKSTHTVPITRWTSELRRASLSPYSCRIWIIHP